MTVEISRAEQLSRTDGTVNLSVRASITGTLVYPSLLSPKRMPDISMPLHLGATAAASN
eukprot:CAMPEP_0178493188 /NCGR_PEP_ID=MMETSP0696-20121128/12337_1 /TAXON_ID=265572 /ORGANISM="Extubocellulus spinifer, Strain CCMP396" /LENGTH=58 /DNA_ID=CAMNT_0020121161 /DNA_START=282 /DNA_END=455 /DNA_ORIENTATION=+